MQPIHARYPFLAEARAAVEEAGVDLAAVIADDEAVVERGRERVEWAITEGTVGDPHRRTRVELLSYPVARVLVSLVDQHVLTRKYAQAEAETAHERFTEELAAEAEFKSAGGDRLSMRALLSEFDLTGDVRPVGDAAGPGSGVGAGGGSTTGGGVGAGGGATTSAGTAGGDGTSDAYRVGVGAYLDLAADQRGDRWRLVNRALDDGEVPVDHEELLALLRQAVRHRVADGLPLSVPDAFGEELSEEVASIEETLSELELTREIDTVVPELFPPCMKHLLDQVQKGEHLEHHSRFAIASFLTSIGMNTDEIVDLFQVNPGFGEDATRYQVDHIRGATGPTDYSAPSCATMQSYGDCVNMDDLCERISHPMAYYEKTIDDTDEDELTDWREQQGDDDGEADSDA